jgi:hypothetical protein
MVRDMRRSGLLDSLTTRTKQRLLAATVLDPDREWYLLELARQLGVPPSSIQRDLAGFVQAGVLRRRSHGNRVYFRADTDCPIFTELRSVLLKTAGLVEVLREALAPLSAKIELAFVYGSIASSEEHSTSDVDLMVVGGAKLSDIASKLRRAEAQTGRNINPTVYTGQEFARKVGERSHFLTTVLQKEILFVHGGKGDLDRLARGPAREAPQNKPRGVAGSSRRRRTGS